MLLNLGAAAKNWQFLVLRAKVESKSHVAPDSTRDRGGDICPASL